MSEETQFEIIFESLIMLIYLNNSHIERNVINFKNIKNYLENKYMHNFH